MKKLISLFLLCASISLTSTTVFAGSTTDVYVNGDEIIYDTNPVMKDGTTLVPLRKTFEALGASVDWNSTTGAITANKTGTTIKLTVGENTAYKNNTSFNVSVEPQLIKGRVYVPLRFVAESFGAVVDYFSDYNVVSIYNDGIGYKIKPNNVPNGYGIYGTSDPGLLLSNLLSGNVVKISGEYYATPEYVNALSGRPRNDTSALSSNYKNYSIIPATSSLERLLNEKIEINIPTPTTNDLDGYVSGQDDLEFDEDIADSSYGIVANVELEEPTYDSVANPWITRTGLNNLYNISFAWLGEEIVFTKYGDKIYTLTGSPAGHFEPDKIYTSDGISYTYDKTIKHDTGIVFKYDDLVSKGIID